MKLGHFSNSLQTAAEALLQLSSSLSLQEPTGQLSTSSPYQALSTKHHFPKVLSHHKDADEQDSQAIVVQVSDYLTTLRDYLFTI
jgi:hypothetical protein